MVSTVVSDVVSLVGDLFDDTCVCCCIFPEEIERGGDIMFFENGEKLGRERAMWSVVECEGDEFGGLVIFGNVCIRYVNGWYSAGSGGDLVFLEDKNDAVFIDVKGGIFEKCLDSLYDLFFFEESKIMFLIFESFVDFFSCNSRCEISEFFEVSFFVEGECFDDVFLVCSTKIFIERIDDADTIIVRFHFKTSV